MLLGCGSDTPAPVCAFGTAVACRCDDGRQGAAICGSDGTSFDGCDCSGASRSSSASGGSPGCGNDLSNVGTGDFSIALDLTTTQAGIVSIADQRDVCGRGVFWEIRLVDGRVDAYTDDGTTLTEVLAGVSVADGTSHHIVLMRMSQVLTVLVDGVSAGSMPAPAALGPLAPIAIGTDVCDGASGMGPLTAGAVTDVCVEFL